MRLTASMNFGPPLPAVLPPDVEPLAPELPPPGPRVVIAEDAVDLAPHVPAWDALADAIPDANSFFESWMFLPAVRRLSTDVDLICVLVYAPEPDVTSRREQLIGFFPLERVKRYRGLPCSALRTWQHHYCFDGTPLVRPEYGVLALEQLFAWLHRDRLGGGLLELPQVALDSTFYQAMVDFWRKQQRPRLVLEEYTRALFRPRHNAEAFFAELGLTARRRRENERRRRRLADQGTLRHDVLDASGSCESWIEEFLTLEASGWKGREGSAMASAEADREFFREMARGAHARGKLQFSALRVGEKAVAMACNFHSGEGGHSFKIAFDENQAKHSPGVLLELEEIRRMHDLPTLKWMDSCAAPDHPMINRVWLDRRILQTTLLATGRRGSHLTLALLPLLKWCKRAVRGLFRRPPASPETPS
jgi:CelD/BcsL family acetyltransferase involved in cellulose biosynthesis